MNERLCMIRLGHNHRSYRATHALLPVSRSKWQESKLHQIGRELRSKRSLKHSCSSLITWPKKFPSKSMPNVSPTKLQSAKMAAFGSSKTPITAAVNSTSNHFLANCWAAVNWKKTTCNTMFTVNHGSYQETPLHRSDVRYNDFHFPPEKLTAFLCAQSPHLCQYPQPASPSKDFWCQAMNVVIRDLDLNRADP